MKKSIIILASLLLFSCSQNIKQNQHIEFKNDYLEFIDLATKTFESKYGMAIAVVKGNDIIFEKYLGTANAETNTPVSNQTLFYIASITKSFTAMSALILESKGKLDLNKNLAELFPEIIFPPELNAEKITIKDLIVHTSGLSNDPIEEISSFIGNHGEESIFTMLQKYTKTNPNSPYGVFEYTNLGYNILDLILQREIGLDWKSLVESEVFNPLMMHNSTTRLSTAINQGWEIAKPHTQNNLENKLAVIPLEKNDNIMHAAGGIYSTLTDMSQWMKAQLNNGNVNGKQIFDEQLIIKSQAQVVKQNRNWYDMKRFAYGYGWNITKSQLGDTIIQHHGSFEGMHPQFSFNPKTKIGVIVLANEGQISYPLSSLLSAYVIDYFSKRQDLNDYYSQKLIEYRESYTNKLKSYNDYISKIKQKPWALELPCSNYLGTYYNEVYGPLIVEITDEKELLVTIGNLRSNFITAHKANSIRVQFGTSGSVIQFELNKERVNSAIWKGQRFIKE
jgi:CubicO group peptidase (beta-lactamase class C family)